MVECIHMFGNDELQITFQRDEESFDSKIKISHLSTFEIFLDHILSKKQQIGEFNNKFHRITILDGLFVDYIPQNLKKGFRINFTDLDHSIYNLLIDDIFSHIIL